MLDAIQRHMTVTVLQIVQEINW